MPSEEVVLAIGYSRVMGVGGAHNATFIRVITGSVLHSQTVLVGLPHVTASDMRDAAFRVAQQVGQDFVISELVIRREQGMSFGGALDLLDLVEALIAITGGCPRCVNRSAKAIHINREHSSVAQVCIVRNAK